LRGQSRSQLRPRNALGEQSEEGLSELSCTDTSLSAPFVLRAGRAAPGGFTTTNAVSGYRGGTLSGRFGRKLECQRNLM